jgi:NTE family protein
VCAWTTPRPGAHIGASGDPERPSRRRCVWHVDGVESVPAPADAAERISSLGELGNPRGEHLQHLLSSMEWLRVEAGSRIFSEGDPADGWYVLFEGRVRFVVESATMNLTAWELDPVGVFGEGALLTGEGRSRTAVVLRDALLARIPPAVFVEVMQASPGVAAAIARRVARRTVFPGADERRRPRADVTITLISPSVPTSRLEPLREAAAAAISPPGEVVAVGCDRAGDVFDAVRHSDRVLVVADSTAPVDLTSVADMVLHGVDRLAAATLELVLLDPPGASHSDQGEVWRPPQRFTHRLRIRERDPADLRRLGRHVSGRSVGLVLGGGGARGLAHIGVLRALAEHEIPIDTVGGSSMGAIIGGQLAMGWSWEHIYAHNRRVWNDWRLRFEITLPTVSLMSGRRSRRIFDETFGGHAIEDFRLPFFCTSVDLSSFRLAVHREGPAALWIRASASAPGLWPPVVDAAGHLHIDGGQLNNVPTDLLRECHDGPVIAVDVFAKHALMTLGPGARPPVGLRHLVGRRSTPRYPSIADTFTRCALLGSLQHQEGAQRYADLYITPDLTEISFRAFHRIDVAADIGYRAALDCLSNWKP